MVEWIQSQKERYVVIALLVLLGVVFLTPPIAYLIVFGSEISTVHQRWAEFGNYISGVYTPILSILTLLLLALQFRLQRSSHQYHLAQNFVTDARNEINYHIETLKGEHQKALHGGITLGGAIRSINNNTGWLVPGKSPQEDLVLRNSQTVIAAWSAIYNKLHHLKMHKHSFYDLEYHSSIVRLMAALGDDMCVALDNLFYRYTGNAPKLGLLFKVASEEAMAAAKQQMGRSPAQG